MTDRHATVRTPLDAPDTVAAALRPDNTAEMATRTDDGAVVTDIERDSTSGLSATLDDYLVNLRVAKEVATHADRFNQSNHE